MAIVTPADGPSFGIAPGRDVDVDVGVLEEVGRDAESLGARADVAERRLRRLLHHVAELAGEREALLAAPCVVASMKRMSPPIGVQARPMATPGSLGALGHLGEEALRAEELAHLLRGARAPARSAPR